MGLPKAPGTRCMLMLAVAAGESGANPELSRNGVLVCVRVFRVPARASVRGPADSAPGRPVRVPDVRASRNGPVDARPVRVPVCCPLPSPRPRAERGRAPRDHRASRSCFSGRRERRPRCRAAADPDRADRRPPRRRPRPGRRRRAARPVRPCGRGRTAGAGHRGGGRAHLRGPRLLPARRPAADPRHPHRGRLTGVTSFTSSIATGHREGLIADRTAEFVLLHPDRLDALIDPRADDRFGYFGLRTLYSRYLLRHPVTRKVVETPQHFLLRVASGLAEDGTPARWTKSPRCTA